MKSQQNCVESLKIVSNDPFPYRSKCLDASPVLREKTASFFVVVCSRCARIPDGPGAANEGRTEEGPVAPTSMSREVPSLAGARDTNPTPARLRSRRRVGNMVKQTDGGIHMSYDARPKYTCGWVMKMRIKRSLHFRPAECSKNNRSRSIFLRFKRSPQALFSRPL